jgi:hypothetical protein
MVTTTINTAFSGTANAPRGGACALAQRQSPLSNFLFGSVNLKARPALRRNDIWELYAGTYIEANTNKIPPISQTKAHVASLTQASDAPRFIVWIDPFEGLGRDLE